MNVLNRARVWIARRILAAAGYEGATTSRRGDGWSARSGAADDVALGGLQKLRDRSRHMVRNHWAATRAVDVLAAHVVGAGILPSCRDNAAYHDLLKRWARPQSQVGAQKGHGLGAVQRLVFRTVVESGSALVVRQWRTSRQIRERALVMPFQLAVLEPEWLDSGRDGTLPSGHRVIHGIEYDSTDWPVAYWLHTENPGSTLRLATSPSRRVPAHDVCHVYWQKRAGQTIGIPWFHAVLLKLRDFDEYEDAQLLRQKIAAMFVAFVRNSPDSAWDTDDEIELYPGRVQRLEFGEEVEFSKPPEVSGFGEYSSITLHSIAAGIGLTYEDLSGDYSRVNFSSARMGSLVARVLTYQWQFEMMIGQLCQSLDEWTREGARFHGVNATGAGTLWTPPRRELIDPSREVGAIERAIAAGLTSRQEEVRKLGRNVEDVDLERRDDLERERRLELASDSPGDDLAFDDEPVLQFR